MDRRNFILNIARGTLAAILVAVGIDLLLREEDENKCELDFICKNCKEAKSCILPEAIEFRKSVK